MSRLVMSPCIGVVGVAALLWVCPNRVCAEEVLQPEAEAYVLRGDWPSTMMASLARATEQGETIAPLPNLGRSDFTIMAWILTRRGGTIFAKAPAEGNWAPQGKTFFVRGGTLHYDIGWAGCVSGRRFVADDQWHHVALVAEERGRRVRLYVDGQLDAEGSLNAEADPAGFVAKIGSTSDNFPSPSGFDGLIDELRIFSVCLGAEDIAAHADRPDDVTNTRRGLVRHFRFEQATGGDGCVGCEGNLTGATFTAGRVGRAARFSGDGRLVLPSNPAEAVLERIWSALAIDFPDARSLLEMRWEREDGIWTGWQPDDWGDLRRRYFEAARTRDADSALAAGASERDVIDLTAALAMREVYLLARHGEARRDLLEAYRIDSLRASIAYLAEQSPAHREYLRKVDSLAERGAALADPERPVAEWDAWVAELETLRHAALVEENPLLNFDQIVFIRRKTYQSSHYYTDFIDGCRDFGGNLCVLNLHDGSVREVVPSMGHGIFGRFDISFEGDRVVFDWKENSDVGFRIFEVRLDGTGLRQLTFPPDDETERVRKYSQRGQIGAWAGKPLTYLHFTDDMHPCYLPDGGIAFISTRCEYGILCDGPDVFSTTVLYRMDGDGRHMEKLSNSSVSEATPSVTNDGRILYTRWEYLDKGAVSVKCLWSMNPDGTGSAEVYGNNIADPCTLLYGRAIPGRNNLFVCCGVPHCCPIPGVGTVLRIDTTRDIRTLDPLTYITPDIRIHPSGHDVVLHRRNGHWIEDRDGPLFQDPYPLADASTGFGAGRYFLVSHNPDRPWNDVAAYGLYLLDDFGNRAPIHTEPQTSCWQPMPLAARRRPPVLPSMRDEMLAAEGLARLVVADVHHGLEGVPRGTIKYLRVNEQVPRPWAARRRWSGDEVDQQHACISMNTNLGLKVQWGVVPVEADGSAHFLVPADRNIFLQALDEDFMEVQRERTYVNYRPGETRACVGCHERPGNSPPTASPLLRAMTRPASEPGPQPGETSGRRPLHYPEDVQPVLDRHCVSCHGGDQLEGNLDLRGTHTTHFSVSYENLLRRKLLPIIGENHPKWRNVEYLPPYSLGSNMSTLISLLREGHEGVQLSPEEMIRLTTWVDANGQYYGSYWGRRNIAYQDHPNYRPTPTFEQAIGTVSPVPEPRR